MRVNSLNIEELKQIEHSAKDIRKWIKILGEEEPKNINEIILIKYIKHQRTGVVEKEVNDMGYRVGNRKYIHKDIKDIILSGDEVREELKICAKNIYHFNKGKISWNKVSESAKSFLNNMSLT